MPDSNLNVTYVSPVHDLCSCAACGATNKDPDTDVFDIRADKSHIRLCRPCAQSLMDRADRILKLTAAPDDWKSRVCADVLRVDAPSPYQAARMGELLESIPDTISYACLAAAYRGIEPSEQILRVQDGGARIGPMLKKDARIAADTAMAFLRHPSRKAFLETGRSDLEGSFQAGDLELLRAAHILVEADLSARSDAYILAVPGMTLQLAALCAVVKTK